jgi:NitT/TauT family transport system substrate-binding protein
MRPLTVLMPFDTPFYAPPAVGVALGHFAAEGLEVTVQPAARFGKSAVQALGDGSIDITLSGIMRSLVLADEGGPRLVHFAEVCSRNGFFLLGRRPMPDFRWTDLVGKTVIGFAEAPTPWQCLLTVLRRNGVDPASVRIDRTRPAPEAIGAFRAGHGDFLEQTQPVVEELLDAGVAHLAASMGEAGGPVPFTSYMTTPAFLERSHDLVRRFTRAVLRTQRWMSTHGADEIADAIAPTFPAIDRAARARMIARYLRQDTWAHDPVIRRASYDILHEILLTGGLIKRRHRYEDLIDTECAEAVLRDPDGR